MNFDTLWYWLILLLVGVICTLLGYLWGRGRAEVIDTSSELKALEDENAKLQAELEACNKKLGSQTPKGTAPDSPLASTPPAMVFDAMVAKAAFGKRIKQDDLKIVEGIGPKIEALFHNFDIKSWKALSEATVDQCQEVLNSGGERYRIHDPSSWPMQAKMAYEGKWKNLVKWQDEHKAGKF
ncbi:MAG: hypothetical protein AAGC45_14680 [Bacteroidota bacterium]